MPNDINAHASRPWSEADRARQLLDIASWLAKYHDPIPCASCGTMTFGGACPCGVVAATS